MSTWVRTVQTDLSWTSGNTLLVSVPRGSTLLRTHFGWGWQGFTAADAAWLGVSRNIQVMGICTTVGDTTESVPNARTQAGDESPPTERWLYWEGRSSILVAEDRTDTVSFWTNSLPQAVVDSKSQVSAKAIAAGDTLNVWASWAAASDWSASGNVELWLWSSVLYNP